MNSLGFAVSTATLVMGAAGVLMLYAHQSRGRTIKVADLVTAIPATVPHTVIGVAALVAFSRPPLQLYGTVFILLLAYVIVALPYAARSASAAAGDIGHELVEASRVFRATQSRTLLRILLPIALPGLAAGWVVVFVHTPGEITASALLSGPGNPVLGRVMLDLASFGSFPQVTTLAVVMTAVNAIFVIGVLRLARRKLMASVR